tara:strand:- start:22 stop:513 length:492 start_codon:yes stop_codon:yes gene_type:complete
MLTGYNEKDAPPNKNMRAYKKRPDCWGMVTKAHPMAMITAHRIISIFRRSNWSDNQPTGYCNKTPPIKTKNITKAVSDKSASTARRYKGTKAEIAPNIKPEHVQDTKPEGESLKRSKTFNADGSSITGFPARVVARGTMDRAAKIAAMVNKREDVALPMFKRN